jgi:hypothetical protein
MNHGKTKGKKMCDMKKTAISILCVFFCMLVMLFLGMTILSGCTLSFQNVMTSGEANDIVDSSPQTDADVDGTLTLPTTL